MRANSRRLAWVSMALVASTSVWVLGESLALMRADWASAAARRDVVSWVSGAAAPENRAAWESARKALEASLAATPDDPDLHERMGDLQTVAGQRDWTDLAKRREDFGLAAASYQRAIALRPSEPETWAMLAAALQAAGGSGDRIHAAWATARRLGPFEGHVQPVLMQIVLSDWAGASTQMQEWATQLFDAGTPGARIDINAMAQRYGLKFDASSAAPSR